MSAEDWKPLLDDLARRTERAEAEDRRPPKRGTARQRIRGLVDEDSFVELGRFAGDEAADGFIAGRARIHGVQVFVGAEDWSYAGGSIGVAGASKRVRLCELAERAQAPLVLILDGAGHRATNLLQPHRPAPNDLQLLADLMGRVPIITVVAGPSAGHGALAAPFSDLVVMAGPEAALFTAGPPVVRASLGEEVTKAELGGGEVHCVVSGLAHQRTDTETEGLELVREWIELACHQYRPELDGRGVDSDRDSELLEVIPVDPRRPYDMQLVIAEILDYESWLEIQPEFGASLLTGFGRLGGHSIAVLANQPMVRAGTIDSAAAEKGARFLETCELLGLPVLFLTDNPGVLAGSASERAGILRCAGRMFRAQRALTVPKLQVTLRKAFGFGSSVMAGNPCDNQWLNIALPTATLGGIPARIGAATSRADEQTSGRLAAGEAGGPWRQAHSASFDDVVDPRELRRVLLESVAAAPRSPRPWVRELFPHQSSTIPAREGEHR